MRTSRCERNEVRLSDVRNLFGVAKKLANASLYSFWMKIGRFENDELDVKDICALVGKSVNSSAFSFCIKTWRPIMTSPSVINQHCYNGVRCNLRRFWSQPGDDIDSHVQWLVVKTSLIFFVHYHATSGIWRRLSDVTILFLDPSWSHGDYRLWQGLAMLCWVCKLRASLQKLRKISQMTCYFCSEFACRFWNEF